MSHIKPTLEEFRNTLRISRDNPNAEHIIFNFWRNWDKIAESINTGEIKIGMTETFFKDYLQIHHPHYALVAKLRSIGRILFFSGFAVLFLPLLFHSLPLELFVVGIAFILIGILITCPYHFVEGRKYAYRIYRLESMKRAIRKGNWSRGMAVLCAEYISDHIGLYSGVAEVCWPEYPALILSS